MDIPSMELKTGKIFLFLRYLNLPREGQILTIRNTILVIRRPCVSKEPYDFKFNQEIFSKSFLRTVMKKYGKSALMKILLVFGTV